MRKFLGFALSCGIWITVSAQIEVSEKTVSKNQDKYTLTPVKGLKKGMGRLNLAFPPGVDWSVSIYSTQDKFLTNRSSYSKHKSYELSPGIYHLQLNPVRVENVLIEAGKDTRLKFGVLEINSDDWELRSEDDKFLTSGNKPKKMALPIGKYQLQQGRDNRLVEITEAPHANIEGIIDEEKWVLTPLEFKTKASLELQFPVQIPTVHTSWVPVVITKGNAHIHSCGTSSMCSSPYSIEPGFYDVKINSILVSQVPVRSSYSTRIKTGVLEINSPVVLQYQFYDANQYPISELYGSLAEKKIVLPIGKYFVRLNTTICPVEIFDDRTTALNGLPCEGGFPADMPDTTAGAPMETDQWKITPLIKSNPAIPKTDSGTLNLNMPATWTLKIIFPGRPEMVLNDQLLRGQQKNIKLPSGQYKFVLNNIDIIDVPVRANCETRLKAGRFKISSNTWFLYDKYKYKQFMTGTGPKTVLLPAGEYKIKTGALFYTFSVRDQGITEENETEQWVISPLKDKTKSTGSININFPEGFKWQIKVKRPTDDENHYFSLANPDFVSGHPINSLPPAEYLVELLYGIKINNVPVKKGMDTRLKLGFLTVSLENQWNLYDESKQIELIKNVWHNGKFVLPPGNYFMLNVYEGYRPVIIRDRETTHFKD